MELRQARWAEKLGALLAEAGHTLDEAAVARKGAAWKVALALRLRREAGAAVPWIAGKLFMGQPAAVSGYLCQATCHTIN